MAFRNIKGIKVGSDGLSGSSKQKNTFIIGDYLGVFNGEGELSAIYQWDDVTSISKYGNNFSISVAKETFKIQPKDFKSGEEFLLCKAIIEGAVGDYGIPYRHGEDALPPKFLYTQLDFPKDSIVVTSHLDEGEISSSYLAIVNNKIFHVLWGIAGFSMIVVFFLLINIFGGDEPMKFLYYFPISVASGIIIGLIIYLFQFAIAKSKFKSIAKRDLSFQKPVTYGVSRLGFSEIEDFIYSSYNMITWDKADYFIETDRLFIVVRKNSGILRLPKRLFDKRGNEKIGDILRTVLEER